MVRCMSTIIHKEVQLFCCARRKRINQMKDEVKKIEIYETKRTILPAGEIVELKQNKNGTYTVVQRNVVSTPEFVLIKAEEISLEDEFMQHEPKTKKEAEFKELVKEVIERRIKNFWRPIYDPVLTDDDRICFEPGKKPAIGKSYIWWKGEAKMFLPKNKSRLGTRLEYVAFLAVLIKKLVEEGEPLGAAWNLVCNDSRDLGHYINSEDAREELEPTGSRAICGFYDLANTDKFLAEDVETGGFWLASGCYTAESYFRPLADLGRYTFCNNTINCTVGWLVLEK